MYFPAGAICRRRRHDRAFPSVAVAEALARRGADTMMMTDRRGARLLTGTSFSVLPAGSPFQRGLIRKVRAALQLGVEGAEGAGTPWIGWFKAGLLQAGYAGERTQAGFVAWATARQAEL